MREKKCLSCGNRISSNSKWFEYPLPIPATTNEEVASLRQHKSSTAFETLVKVPLFQSGIYGLLYGLPAGIMLSAIVVNGNSFVIISSTAFLVTGISWTKLSSFFNGLLVPFEEMITGVDNDEQKTIVNMNITDKENKTMTIGNIPSEIAIEDVIEFAKVVKRDLSIARWVSENVHLTQAKFTQKPNRIFSQPKWTKFIKYLEGRKLVERKNKDAKNSPVILTRTGVNFILQCSELEL